MIDIHCPRCGAYHYFANEDEKCEAEYAEMHTNVEIVEDANIDEPPEIEAIFVRTVYALNDPNASWSLPK